MSTLNQYITRETLKPVSKTAIQGQILYIALALLLPTITHRFGLNYLVAQPMHWMILFAGLTYGAYSGLAIGLIIPVASFMISGMPMPAVIPLMMVELGVYGFMTGFLKKKISAFGAVAAALVTGRLVYLLLVLLTGKMQGTVGAYIQATWVPGLFAVILQIALLPVLAGLYVKKFENE